MTILVTGATGQLGAKVVEALLETVPAQELAASVRTPEKAGGLRARGVDVRRGDFDDPASLDEAFTGVDRLLIISTDGDTDTRARQHGAAIAAASRARVGLIAYTSVTKADDTPVFVGPAHRASEAAIRATGIPYCFLRNNWYVENDVGTIRAVLAGAPLATSAGEGRVGWASREDYARAAAAVLAGTGHENTVYELAGPPRTYVEFAAVLARVIGRDVPVKHIGDAAYEEMLAGAKLPEFVVKILSGIQGSIRERALDIESDDLAKLLARPVTPLHDVLAGIVSSLSASS